MAWRSYGSNNTEFINSLWEHGVIKSERIKEIMLQIDRKDFIKNSPYVDSPQSISYGVTISAPHMHAAALELLKDHLKPGDKALDIGSGSGYLTACMGMMVSPNGKAVGVEHIPELVESSLENIKKHHAHLLSKDLVKIIEGDGRLGYKALSPYNAIHVGAASPDKPKSVIILCIYKLYTGFLARRTHVDENGLISRGQKGFMPYDGVFEHNFVLQNSILEARRSKKELCMAWLDLASAFNSIPHHAMLAGLRAIGANSSVVDIQGCPLSGILFNIAKDPLLRKQESDPIDSTTLAYADDIVLLTGCANDLQRRLDIVASDCERIRLALNPGKCAVMHFSGQAPVGVRESMFKINGGRLRCLKEGESEVFLGRPTGFLCDKYDDNNRTLEVIQKINGSKLASFKKLDAIKTFVFLTLSFTMRCDLFAEEVCDKIDKEIRSVIKSILSLPRSAVNNYIYGSCKLGAIGIPLLAEDSDIYRIDNAYKLLTSKDPLIRELAMTELGNMVASRTGTWNIWTRARQASSRLTVTWEMIGEVFMLIKDDVALEPLCRRLVVKRLREVRRSQRDRDLRELRNQGKVMECVGQHPASHFFLTSGQYISSHVWRFIHRARLNKLPLNARPGNTRDQRCRRCGISNETLPHVLNH
ncbi:unnamed protein product [Gordionus sp. m RMFG-2023]